MAESLRRGAVVFFLIFRRELHSIRCTIAKETTGDQAPDQAIEQTENCAHVSEQDIEPIISPLDSILKLSGDVTKKRR